MTDTKLEKTRFDARLTVEQKHKFELASSIAGFKNLSEYVITTVTRISDEIIEKSEKIIASKRDSEIFFDAITNPKPPGKRLKEAFKKYEKFNE